MQGRVGVRQAPSHLLGPQGEDHFQHEGELMARRRRKKSARAGRCKVVSVNGKRRRICWGRKGITSNRKA